MPDLHVTEHAIDRYLERVAPLTRDEARSRLSTVTIQLAAVFGDCEVILRSGHRAVICNRTVVTVRPLPRRKHRHRRVREFAE